MADVFVVGSINQDFVLSVERRPEPGETVTDAQLSKGNGGKGANQAAAAALLGADVTFLGRVGDDGFGEPLVEALADKGVDTSLIQESPDSSTGTAFITVTPDGENAITVAPGANRSLTTDDVDDASESIGRCARARRPDGSPARGRPAGRRGRHRAGNPRACKPGTPYTGSAGATREARPPCSQRARSRLPSRREGRRGGRSPLRRPRASGPGAEIRRDHARKRRRRLLRRRIHKTPLQPGSRSRGHHRRGRRLRRRPGRKPRQGRVAGGRRRLRRARRSRGGNQRRRPGRATDARK